VRYRDFQHVLPVFVQILLFASPVAYGGNEVPHSARPFFYLNPLAPVLEAFRFSALGVGQVHWGYLLYSAGVAAGLLVVGTVLFDRVERDFADVI
jgi:lipopolysaccharide transport system permease protein